MILIDTSAWIEFLRDTGSPVCNRVDALLAEDIAICDAVRMEVLAGARSEQHLQQLRRLLARATVLPTGPIDYDHAAAIYRQCRGEGETVRKLIDCLIVIGTEGPLQLAPMRRSCIETPTSMYLHATPSSE